jgi:predicted Fe-Mo cluster-binding NifX family protein
MRILFTTQGKDWDAMMDARLGRSAMALIYDEEKKSFEPMQNDAREDGHGAGLKMATKVLEKGVDVIITGNGAGEKALDVLRRGELKIFTGAGQMRVKEAYEAYQSGTLVPQSI